MTDFKTTSLHRISQLPLDANAEIFREYPAFKLGVTAAVRHYAQLLLPLVQQLITNNSIFTAPPITCHTPAAANLLCWELFEMCRREDLSSIDIQYDESMGANEWTDPTRSRDYAKLNFADRVTERELLSRRMLPNADFRGRPVLFVNDICVTGAQQHTMQRYFERIEAACVHWLYVIVIDPEIGKAQPDIEWQINFTPFEDLLRMVSREEIQFTGKCVQRLMHLNTAELEEILRALNNERRARLLELAIMNGFENLADFQQQMELVRSYATERMMR
jgi:PRTase ComF-like